MAQPSSSNVYAVNRASLEGVHKLHGCCFGLPRGVAEKGEQNLRRVWTDASTASKVEVDVREQDEQDAQPPTGPPTPHHPLNTTTHPPQGGTR